MATFEETVEAAAKFQKQTKKLISKYTPDFVINTDQTGCNYQTTYNRSLDFSLLTLGVFKRMRPCMTRCLKTVMAKLLVP